MPIATGSTLGRYQIVAPLGQGGMATVYKAFQPALDRYVALKVLRSGIVDDPEQRERFDREAKAIARLRHPSIVQVFDFDSVDGQSFLVMEFVDGDTLKSKLTELSKAGVRLPRRDAARIVSEVADALDTAHALGIVHRDVKPSNVLMSKSGRAIMADFGIARILAASGQTQTGVGIGTPEYMSPEQGEGRSVDHRSDIYSLGVMAYELLTGTVPFHADTPLAVVLAHVRDPLPLASTIDPTIGPDVERVLLKAMAKNPAERYASAGEMARALSSAIEGVPTADTMPTASVTVPPANPATGTIGPISVPAAAPVTPATAGATTGAPIAAPASAARPRKPTVTRGQAATQWALGTFLRVVGLAALAAELLLILRVVIPFIPRTLSPTVLVFIHGLTDPFVDPFDGIAHSIFADPTTAGALDLAAVLGLVAVFVVSRVIDTIGRRLLKRYTVTGRF